MASLLFYNIRKSNLDDDIYGMNYVDKRTALFEHFIFQNLFKKKRPIQFDNSLVILTFSYN